MKKQTKKWPPGVRQAVYYTAVVLLVIASIYQVYLIQANLSDTIRSSENMGEDPVGVEKSLLSPYEMYLTMGDNQSYAKIAGTSGYYPRLCEQSQAFMQKMAAEKDSVQSIQGEDLPDQSAVLVLKYAHMLEHTVLEEQLSLAVSEESGFREIWIQPSTTRKVCASLYLINWEQEQYIQLQSRLIWKDRANQDFCEVFYTVGDALEKEYQAGWKSFPQVFGGGIYFLKKESSPVFYKSALKPSYMKDGELDIRKAADYIMHFFPHSDATKSIGNSEDLVWYADEKRTVRLEPDGFLQYVQTPDRMKSQEVSLTEAYQIAASFLEEDLANDMTRVMEVYLIQYEIQNGKYTFYWNYRMDNVPLLMDPKRQEEWELPYPIKITIEDGIVRYYHRYLVSKEMQPDQMIKVPVSYMDALNICLGSGIDSPIMEMELAYEEQGDTLIFCWRILSGDGWYTLPLKGGGL